MLDEKTGKDTPQPSLSRRAFLARLSVSAAVASTAMSAPAVFAKNDDESADIDDTSAETHVSGTVGGEARRERAFQIRLKAAIAEHKVPIPLQIDNGDELRYPNRIGSFSKALPHDKIGEVDPRAYGSLLTAVSTGDPQDFDRIPLGGTTKLANPQGGLTFSLEGTDTGQLTIPPAPALASAERAGEMVEDYWMALTRDIPFSQYGKEPVTAAAIAELNTLSDFRGPKVAGQVTAGTLFRGRITGFQGGMPGDLVGPYISQFLLQDVNFGALIVKQKYQTRTGGLDYLTDFASWLRCQDGRGPFPPPKNAFSGTTTYIKNGRDLAAYDHVDFYDQAYLTAALWLLQKNVPFNKDNPYPTTSNQGGGITFGNNRVLSLLYEVSIQASRAVFYQKWQVHRTLRPEAYGGLVHNTLTRVADYPLHGDVLNSHAVSSVFSRYGTYLLPHADWDGCPAHPSYAEAHSSGAGASITALKWLFDESFVIPNPVVATDDGQSLIAYTESDAGQMTVGGELNKLASNIALGRDIEAVHWRSDAVEGLLLGEAAAISVLADQRSTYNERFGGLTFTMFDGTKITV